MSRRKLTAIFVLLVLVGAAAVFIWRPIVVPNKPTIAAVLPTAPTQDPASRAQSAALAFRAIVTEAPELAQSVLAQMPAGIAAESKGSGGLGPLAWRTFFAASAIHVGVISSEHPVFVFYNPFSDVAVIGSWDFSEAGSPQVTRLCATPGSALDQSAPMPSRYPLWMHDTDPFAALRKTFETRMHAIAERFPRAAATSALLDNFCSTTQQSLAELRLYDAISGLTQFARSHGKAPLAQFLQVAAVSAPAGLGASFPGLSSADLEVVAKAAPQIGKYLPVSALLSQDQRTYLVVLVQPRSARQFLIVDIAGDQRVWHVSHVLDLAFTK
jgi:hypothetical protein